MASQYRGQLVKSSEWNVSVYWNSNNSVRAHKPGLGLAGIRMLFSGIRLQMWTRVTVNRCIGKIIAIDPTLVASRLYWMAVSRPQSHVAVTHTKNYLCANTVPNLLSPAEHCRGLSYSQSLPQICTRFKIIQSYVVHLLGSPLHVRDCRCFAWASENSHAATERTLIVSWGWPWSILNYLKAPARLTGVCGWFACGFWIIWHCSHGPPQNEKHYWDVVHRKEQCRGHQICTNQNWGISILVRKCWLDLHTANPCSGIPYSKGR